MVLAARVCRSRSPSTLRFSSTQVIARAAGVSGPNLLLGEPRQEPELLAGDPLSLRLAERRRLPEPLLQPLSLLDRARRDWRRSSTYWRKPSNPRRRWSPVRPDGVGAVAEQVLRAPAEPRQPPELPVELLGRVGILEPDVRRRAASMARAAPPGPPPRAARRGLVDADPPEAGAEVTLVPSSVVRGELTQKLLGDRLPLLDPAGTRQDPPGALEGGVHHEPLVRWQMRAEPKPVLLRLRGLATGPANQLLELPDRLARGALHPEGLRVPHGDPSHGLGGAKPHPARLHGRLEQRPLPQLAAQLREVHPGVLAQVEHLPDVVVEPEAEPPRAGRACGAGGAPPRAGRRWRCEPGPPRRGRARTGRPRTHRRGSGRALPS